MAEQAKVSGYWTPERMRSAVPLDRLLKPARRLSGIVAAGKPLAIRPTSASSPGGSWTTGGKVVRTEGRVFFLYADQRDSSSGTAVTSRNKSTVITAGHCVKLDGSFHANWAFVPAYRDGKAPYGTWTARKTLATPKWVASEDMNYDVGAAVLNPRNGKRLTDMVGGQGIAFNQARGQSMTCDMTGGASGGGWFLRFSEATGAGTLNSVNSYKSNLVSLWMFGPYFGADAQRLYNSAQSA